MRALVESNAIVRAMVQISNFRVISDVPDIRLILYRLEIDNNRITKPILLVYLLVISCSYMMRCMHEYIVA
jgi:hypothetical protein